MLSLEEYKKLSDEEQYQRYNELSKEDKYKLSRSFIPKAIPISGIYPVPEKIKKEARKGIEQMAEERRKINEKKVSQNKD